MLTEAATETFGFWAQLKVSNQPYGVQGIRQVTGGYQRSAGHGKGFFSIQVCAGATRNGFVLGNRNRRALIDDGDNKKDRRRAVDKEHAIDDDSMDPFDSKAEE